MTILDGSIYGDELDLEAEYVTQGAIRYDEKRREAERRGRGGLLTPAVRLYQRWTEKLAKAVHAECKSLMAGKMRREAKLYGPKLLSVHPEKSAAITFQTLFNNLLSENLECKAASLSYIVGRNVNSQEAISYIRKDKQAYKELTHTDRKQLTPEAIMRTYRKYFDDQAWSRKECACVGAWLINAASQAATIDDEQMITIRNVRQPSMKNIKTIFLSPIALDTIESMNEYLRSNFPRYGPMIIPPVDWTSNTSGGYYSIPRLLVKTRESDSREVVSGALDGNGCKYIKRGVNVLQQRGWRVNRRIYDIARELWDSGGNIAGLPNLYKFPLPPKPPKHQAEDYDAWRKEAIEVYRRNGEEVAKRFMASMKLRVAERFLDAEHLWFVHQLDWRGRAYASSLFLSHQSEDLSRGLLVFDTMDKRDDRSEWWMKVHLANCCGVDKCSFEDRVKWVDMSADYISGWAADPLQNTGWMEVDKPFQALAAAIELRDAKEFSVPVQMDGSCNALQHYAALGRCRDEAVITNLVPGKAPRDAYTEILTVVIDIFYSDELDQMCERRQKKKGHFTEDGEPLYSSAAMRAEMGPHLDRKLIKQPLMTTLYGVTLHGATKQIANQLDDRHYDKWNMFRHASILGDITRKGMSLRFPNATAIQDWLKECGKIISHSGRCVSWLNPLGLPCEQPYWRETYEQYSTVIGGMKYITGHSSKPKFAKNSQALAPNFIHSVDSSHMLATAQWMADKGVTIAEVHDSFWTGAGSVDLLRKVSRDAFVSIHEQPLLDRLVDGWRKMYRDIELPDHPEVGEWDIHEMTENSYALS